MSSIILQISGSLCCASYRLVSGITFLQGPAASYFDSFSEEEKGSFAVLTDSLSRCFSPAVDREHYYRQFEEQTLRPGEDPTLFMWRLKDMLHRAEPDLSDTATDAMLRRQFLKGLPQSVRLRLLELDPTPKLHEMLSFAQRFRAVHGETPHSATCGTFTPSESGTNDVVHQHQQQMAQQQQQLQHQQHKMAGLESMIEKLSLGQDAIIAAISKVNTVTPEEHSRRGSSSRPSTIQCFACRKEGHIARYCPQRYGSSRCSLCGGWGHNSEDCANNYSLYSEKSKLPLNFQGVPR